MANIFVLCPVAYFAVLIPPIRLGNKTFVAIYFGLFSCLNLILWWLVLYLPD
ncbi:hypothetical protein JCM19238_3032 [Vibrio ponticus]|nr:hypothetical protein JCM19238_3032 [Vibrio ponticus]